MKARGKKFRALKNLKNQPPPAKPGGAAGFSLVGVLTTASLGVVVALGLAQMQVNQMKTVRAIEAKYAGMSWRAEIEALLRDRQACKKTLTYSTGIWPYRIGQGKRDLYHIMDSSGNKKYSWWSSRGSAQIYRMSVNLGSSLPSHHNRASVTIEVFLKNNSKKDLMVHKNPLFITRNDVRFNRSFPHHPNKITGCF